MTLAGAATTTCAVAELLALFASGVELPVCAVLLMVVPAAVAGSMVTLSVKVAPLPTVIDASEQVTVPFALGAGVVHDHPPGATSDVKRRAGGRTSVIVTADASLGPLLETRMVYCNALPGKSV